MSLSDYQVRGKVVLVAANAIYRSRGSRIEVSEDDGITWQLFHTVEVSWWQKLAMSSHLLSRLLRLGVHHFITCPRGFFLVVNSIVYKLDCSGLKNGVAVTYHGSRPLCVTVKEGLLYYGEYISNDERGPVNIYRFDGEKQELVLKAENIRHFHGVFTSPQDQEQWITTGDDGREAGIWRLTSKGMMPIYRGSQQARAVQLLFRNDEVFYGTDTPSEDNFIRKLNPITKQSIALQKVGSSIFYGCTIGGYLVFSTVLEPSPVNETKMAELWCSADGDSWTLLETRKKDIWSFKLFQYGQFQFPHIVGEPSYLWYYIQGLHGSGRSFRVPLNSLS